MPALLTALLNDEAGVIISAELVLVATIAVLSMVVGLSVVAHGISRELCDVGTAFSAMDQSYRYSGIDSRRDGRGHYGQPADLHQVWTGH